MNKSGEKGETYAADCLVNMGYKILACNYHSRYGEVDIIASTSNYICFVEVKTRKIGSVVSAKAAVSFSKQKKIITTSLLYLQDFRCDLQPRFDVFCVETAKNGEIIGHEYITGAFNGEAYNAASQRY